MIHALASMLRDRENNPRRSIVREYGPPAVLGIGLAVLVASVVSVVRHGYDSPAALADLAGLLERAGDAAHLDGDFVPFALAVAHRESRFNPRAQNLDALANSCEAYDNSAGIFANNPYGRQAFCIGTGGLFGFMPATGLKPAVFRNLDPQLIFDPTASVAMFVDYVERIVTNYFPKLPAAHRNWLAVRRSMAGLDVMYDVDESTQRAREVRDRLAVDLAAIGADPDIMYDRPELGPYPGAAVVWSALRAA